VDVARSRLLQLTAPLNILDNNILSTISSFSSREIFLSCDVNDTRRADAAKTFELVLRDKIGAVYVSLYPHVSSFFLPRDAMRKRGPTRPLVSICIQTAKDIIKIFMPCSPVIPVCA